MNSVRTYMLLLYAAFLSLTSGAQEAGGRVMLRHALTYVGKPYTAHTLEVNEEEQLVVNLEEVDCTTFVEYVLAQSLAETDGDRFEDYLRKIRYRNGIIDGYTSRLHYLTEWIASGVQNGFIEDLTALHSPDTLSIRLSFMSTHPEAYRHLKDSPANRQRMKAIEERLSGQTVHYLPKEKITDEGCLWIQSGDILCITTDIPGLDVVHLGLAYYQNRQLQLLHASSSKKKVTFSSGSFAEMFAHNPSWTGVRVLRLKRH